MSKKLQPKHNVFDSVSEMISSVFSEDAKIKPIEEHYGLAGSQFSFVEAEGRKFILKKMSIISDWLMFSSQDTSCRSITLWQYGLLDQLLPEIQHKIIACSRDGDGWAILMEDISGHFYAWDKPIPYEKILIYIDALAKIHATFWNDDRLTKQSLGLMRTDQVINHVLMAKNDDNGERGLIPHWIREGWAEIEKVLPHQVITTIKSLVEDPSPVFAAANRYPTTLVHGDYRQENLAFLKSPVVVDWQISMNSLMTIDVAWFLGNEHLRKTISLDESSAYYRQQLEVNLGEIFDAVQWQEMMDLGFAIHALRTIYFQGYFYGNDGKPEQEALIIEWGNRVMDALYLFK